MRKQIITETPARDTPEHHNWLELESLARVELTSEDPAHPIETAFSSSPGDGWRAAGAGTQTLRLVFDKPLQIRHIQLLFRETELSRSQEFVLRWRADAEAGLREIVRQQYNFSPPDSIEELEDYTVALDNLSELELTIIADISGGPAHASLAQLRLA